MYAEVIIPLALPKNYTWSVPSPLQEGLRPGCRVEVTLKNKRYAGIVKRLHTEKPEGFAPKDIHQVLDREPVIFAAQLALWEFLSQYYLCSEGEVMAAALPAHLKLSSESLLVFNEEFGDDFSGLENDEFVVAEALLTKKELRLAEVQHLVPSHQVYSVIRKLIEKKLCFVWEALKNTYKPKQDTFVLLDPVYEEESRLAQLLNEDPRLGRAAKQLELLLAYLHLSKTQGSVTRTDLLKKSGASEANLKGLLDKKILVAQKRVVDRIEQIPPRVLIDFELSQSQQLAAEQLAELWKTKSVCLLHGVTSSGKTQIYIREMANWISQGKQVLYLLPEIALTSQIIRRLQKHFGGNIGIYHSRFSQNERLEIWNKVRSGVLKIILGARSAIFMPFDNLGLVIVDEEHDPSYKQQDPAPRYQGRDAAIYYAGLFHARVLLGSATPSLETYHNAKSGKYGLVRLSERYGNLAMPVIQIVDTKLGMGKPKGKVILTPPLQEAIEHTLQKERQVILFQNRRGYSPYQICQVCGWIPQCKNCDVSLTYHKLSNKLQCHYCGTLYPPLQTCAACGSHQFIQRNFGTEKIEEHLEEIFPHARIARMDLDSVKGKSAHESLIQLFEQGRIDILVGTQMVVKGLDFDRVDLVGILDADSLLGFADFRVNERAFQLMEQVSGRAGRKEKTGKVLIQVANTRHPVLSFVQNHDYEKFYEFEIHGRDRFFYPPFSRLILLTLKHKSQETVDSAAHLVAHNLKTYFEKYLVGPAEPVVGRIRNQYLMEILLKLPKDRNTLQLARQVIQQQEVILAHHPKFKSVTMIADVDVG